MKCKIKAYDCLCALDKFIINGISADKDDFGSQGDRDEAGAEEYGCGDMHFTPKPFHQDVLDKYGITADDYDRIASKLEKELSFGACGWCV